LNTHEGNTDIVSLSSNQFTVQAGTYDIEVVAPAYQVNNHKAKLRDVTNSVDIIIGTANRADDTNVVRSNSVIYGTFTTLAATTFEIQHQSQSTQATRGFGNNVGFGVEEVYTTVILTKR